jgi:hypothetical protein
MYSTRQRDLRERRTHQNVEDHRVAIEVGTGDSDEGQEFESPSWGIRLTSPASAA